MTQNAKVMSVCGDEAIVSVIRRSACEGCKQKNLCAGMNDGCAEQKELITTVKNPIGAGVGDEVVLSTPTSLVLTNAFCVFVLPIIIAFLSYFLFGLFVLSQGVIYLLTLCMFFASCGVICFILDRMMKKDKKVEIVKILKEEN